LQSVSNQPAPAPVAQAQRQAMRVQQLSPLIGLSVDLPPRVSQAPGLDVHFSQTGDFGP